MDARALRTMRWIVGGTVFVAAATILFETAGQSSPRPVTVRPNAYQLVPTDDRTVTTAIDFALADQKKKNRSSGTIKLRKVLSAERQKSKGDNFRVCLALDRRGRPDTARAVGHLNQKQQWSVALWAWGACGKQS